MPFASASPRFTHTSSPTRSLGLALGCALVLSLAACVGMKRGSPESAPPPMKQIDPASSSVARPPVASAPVNAPSSAPPMASAPVVAQNEPAVRGIVVAAGLHRCELARRVLVKRVTTDGAAVQVNWNGKDYSLHAVSTKSGARRFEDAKAGLAWVVISAKAFLLDTKRGQMLANECVL